MKLEHPRARLRRFPASAIAAIATGLLMAACGGGDGDDSPPAGPGNGNGNGNGGDNGGGAPLGAAPTLSVLSSKPEYVSGGDALIQVKLPTGAQASALSLMVNGTAVTTSLVADAATGTLRGLVTGLKDGENTVAASLPQSEQGTLKLTNFPITGPILSGPHMKPYECRTTESGLGAPLDANCSATRKIDYFYRATDDTFKVLTSPAGARPGDMRTTVTNDGRTVPYIVRVDSGTINRSIYRIAVLDDPT
ncbi:MAG: hypothetical protein JWP52_1700, partial [Rhizobacter sp.]|nr:hypothetical protein [Rhizobacter sp.]